MAKFHGAVVVNTERCKGCRLCVVACPCNVLNLKEKEVQCAEPQGERGK